MTNRVLMFGWAWLASAGVCAQEVGRDAVRAEFESAYRTVRSADSDSAALRSYVLYPYLQQLRLRRALASSQPDFDVIDREAEAFFKKHDREAVSAALRREWFESLTQRRQWQRLADNYRDVNDATLQCHWFTARLTLQQIEGLEAQIAAAWSHASESRPACEQAFAWLKSRPAYTADLIAARARAALKSGNAAFARQIVAMLPPESNAVRESLSSWASFVQRPRQSIEAAIATPQSRIEPEAMLDGWIRFVRADANTAALRYAPLIRTRQLNAETASRYALELALSLSWNRSTEALRYFAKVRASEMDERGYEWHARSALWAGEWKLAAEAIDAMPAALAQTTKWKYWRARTLELQGHRESAHSQFAALLQDDNYYAALTAARIGRPYTPNPDFFPVDEQVLQRVAALPDFVRAHELQQTHSLELRGYAYDEWRYGYAKLNPAARAQAGILAARWGWHDQAILTASQQSMFDDYRLLYPRPYDAQINAAANIVSLPPALLYATLRQESLYRVDALSSANAKGLMQLLPDTAAYTARRRPELAKLLPQPLDLFDPTTNIYLGAAKLRDMIDRFGGKAALALAAYNAGPTAAQRWRPAEPRDIDVWIENIPYNETRTYIQRVYWHSVVFGWLMTEQPQDTASWLTTIVRPSAR